jgi:phytoene dehydrogenase-like protein
VSGSSRAVVVGSGPNGLAAAITLAEGGRDVTVLEAAPGVGGAVASGELTLPGFHHDLYSAVYPAGVASPVFARMPLERHGLTWVHPEACVAHVLGEDRAAVLYRSTDRTAANFDALTPGDGERWLEFAGPYLEHWASLRRTMLTGFPPVRGPAGLVRGIGVSGVLGFARLLLMPAEALAHEIFEGPGPRALLYSSAMHGDVPPGGAGSAIAAAYLNIMAHTVGWPSPEGGSSRLAGALAGYLAELGGTIRTSAPVTRVVVEGSKLTGVEVDGGERLPAGLVVADTSPGALLRLAGHALPPRYARALARFRPGPGTIKVDWALDGPIPWSAPEARHAGTVHVGGDDSEVLDTTLMHRRSGLPERPFMLTGQQSVHDPSRAPAGKHTAWAYTHGPQETDWAAETDRHVERMEAQMERFAPGFRDLILARNVMGPGDLERRNRNLVGGDVGGGSYTLDQVIFRPVPSLAPYRTPLRGLYIGSASTFPGGAVHGVPGHAAARLALAESRLPGR